ncbi:MAG: D-glycero-beta-D-manno-heptose-7-phosphate kinase [Acidobacteriota bacterium]|nr:D-glycero-beta-D-manno-heptose-7-phosphate kinase [Acidobacteriota bacterium]
MIEVAVLHRIIERFSQCRILVVGDLMLDRFIWGKVNRISPEAPVPVVQVTRETAHLGGSANVVANLEALGAAAVPVGLLGDDEAGKTLAANFTAQGVTTDGLLFDDDLQTIQKIRIIAQQQQVVRVDREQLVPLNQSQERRLCERIDVMLKGCGAAIVSDYGKLVITPGLLQHIAGRPPEILLAVDPKDKNFDHYRGADVVTPNHGEAERLAGMSIDPENGSLLEAGAKIFDRLQCRKLLITLGEHGMALFLGPNQCIHIPTQAREVFDVSGAGDTVIAVYTLARAAGADDHEAAVLANAAAGVVVGKLGTASLSPAELTEALDRLPGLRG